MEVVSCVLLPLYPLEKEPRHPLEKEAVWAPKLVWTRWRREKIPSLPLPGIELLSSTP